MEKNEDMYFDWILNHTVKYSINYFIYIATCVTCYFKRYNLCTPESDTDMFIVYQAKTKDVLGFNPPKQTIKVSGEES